MIDNSIENARLVQCERKAQWQKAEHIQTEKIISRDACDQKADEARGDYMRSKRRRENLESELGTLDKQIVSLKEENKEVEEKLRKRETDLYKYRFKIKDLNKAKQVLTHRTYEMKANLEPKDAAIQKLKDQYLKLEEVFD